MPKIGNVMQNTVNLEGYSGFTETEMTSMESMRARLEGELSTELKKLDLSANEAKILLYLMSNGSSTASEISKYTRIQRTDTYHYISILLSKGIVFSTFSKPQRYYSMTYEQVVDYLVQTKSNALKEVSEKKRDCQTKLEQIVRKVNPSTEDSYQVLTGENIILTKVGKILSEPMSSVNIFLTERMLAKFYHEGLVDKIAEVTKSGGAVKLKTSKTSMEQDLESENQDLLSIETIDNPSPASFIIIDGKQLFFIIDKNNSSTREISGIYTNNAIMVSTLEYLFQRIA